MKVEQKTAPILVIEDDHAFASILRKQLEHAGYTTAHCDNGEDGLEQGLTSNYSMAIIDIALPKMSGFQVLKRLRDAGKKYPIIVMTNQKQPDYQFETYARLGNPFHPKPLDYPLLFEQIKMLLAIHDNKNNTLSVGDLEINFDTQVARQAGKVIDLSKKELAFLALLMHIPGKVYNRAEIIRATTFGLEEVEPGSIDTMVSRMRRKMRPYKGKPVIQTVFRSGYRLNTAYIEDAS